MNNLKKGVLGVLSSIICIQVLNLISALTADQVISQGPDDLVRIVINFFGPIFSALLGVSQFDQNFFARVLFLILVYIIVNLSLNNIDLFKDRTGINFVVSLVVALLGARYLTEINFIEWILLPYGALMISISVLLPFLVFFFFVHKSMSSGVARRAAWLIFALVFFGLWWTRRNDPQMGELGMIYNIGIAIVAISLFADTTIHRYFGLIEASEARTERIKKQIADIESELNKYANIPNPSRNTRDVINHLESRLKELTKKL